MLWWEILGVRKRRRRKSRAVEFFNQLQKIFSQKASLFISDKNVHVLLFWGPIDTIASSINVEFLLFGLFILECPHDVVMHRYTQHFRHFPLYLNINNCIFFSINGRLKDRYDNEVLGTCAFSSMPGKSMTKPGFYLREAKSDNISQISSSQF